MPAKDQGKFGAKNRARFSEMFRKMTSRPAEREVVTPDIVHESENVMIEESSLPNSAAVAPTAEQVLASAREAENHGDIDITEEEITQMQDAENRDQVVVQENRDQIIVSPHGKEEIISNVALNQEAEASLAAQESSKTIPDENTLEDTSDLEIGKVSTTDSAAMAAADGNEMPVLTKEGKSVRAKIRQFFKKTNNRNQPSEV